MEIFSWIVGGLMILLILAGIITIFKYPKQILLDLPKGMIIAMLGYALDRFVIVFVLLTSPVWVPAWLLSKYYKWGWFDHEFFRLSWINSSVNDEDSEDYEYKVNRKLALDFNEFAKYFVSGVTDEKCLKSCLMEGLESIEMPHGNMEVFPIGDLTLVRNDALDLYSFHYLIQWLKNDYPRQRHYGFASSCELQFFSFNDDKTLHNLLGKTSTDDHFAFNLVNGQEHFLALNNDIIIRSKFDMTFFKELLGKITVL